MALLYDKPKDAPVPVKIQLSFATSTITAIRIQDVARDLWFSWDKNSQYPNGYWNNAGGGGNNAPPGQTPSITPGNNNLYVAFYAVNGYGYGVNMALYIYDANYNTLASNINVLTSAGHGVELEWTGNMPVNPYQIILYSLP